MNMIDEEMFEAMMHMIGYCNLESAFMDAIATCEPEQYATFKLLATWCENRWFTEGVLTDPMIKETSWYTEE
tara:strand:+ start:166 stop:381 length:216 start_codon:yes stop_codon:yes gene_type:complete